MMHPPNKEYDCGWKEYSIVGVGRQAYEGCWDVWVRQSTWRSEHDARKGQSISKKTFCESNEAD